jgi:SAM-dependent methyltransferase
LEGRIVPHLCTPEALGVHEPVDFALAFWMVHEVPDQNRFFLEMKALLKPDGKFLMAEPKIHVTRNKFEATMRRAEQAGFRVTETPKIRLSRAAVLSLPKAH